MGLLSNGETCQNNRLWGKMTTKRLAGSLLGCKKTSFNGSSRLKSAQVAVQNNIVEHDRTQCVKKKSKEMLQEIQEHVLHKHVATT